MPEQDHDPLKDSAGRPWAGRQFEENRSAADDGSAPPELLAAVVAFRCGETGPAAVVDALRGARLLIPLVAKLGESGEGAHGRTVDKSAELAIVTVAGPDGRDVLPVFSSVTAMAAWNPKARPVPADGVRVALAAASERTDLVVLDPASETEFALRRPAVWAMAQGDPWMPAHDDPDVLAAFADVVAPEPRIDGMLVRAGDPDARMRGPEIVLRLRLRPGLDRAELQELLDGVQRRIAASTVIADRVDSMSLKLETAG
ncbi:SseB family protein [Arenivirga flava]|uniref:SseB protein N-terminal domain-containing protein n=1 Tax=Arenivirga flava TaxID=1930060 RepID=A0AA37UP27_9MICO|nr:SseB family protein [Arenivirga flava]GMA27097.1 hypothetical protein GCM10025874_03500 [Arenivirga flava]